MTDFTREWIAKREKLAGLLSAHDSLVDRTSLPAALAALKAVLEEEGPRATGNYSEYSDGYHAALDTCRDAIEATLRRNS